MAKPVGEKVYYDKPDVLQKGIFYHAVWYSDVTSENDFVINIADPDSLRDIDKSLFKHGKTVVIAGK